MSRGQGLYRSVRHRRGANRPSESRSGAHSEEEGVERSREAYFICRETQDEMIGVKSLKPEKYGWAALTPSNQQEKNNPQSAYKLIER
jgi:hypothetical protein